MSLEDEMELPYPTRPPPMPKGDVEARPEDVVFEVDQEGGVFRRFEDGDGRDVFVMIGNPRIYGFEHTRGDGKVAPPFSIKANRMVLWVDLTKFDPTKSLTEMRESMSGASTDVGRAAAVQTMLQEAVLGIYAEGAVELRFGDLEFRAEQLHLEPRTYQALLVEPRFEGLARGQAKQGGDLPLHVKARYARLVAKGVAVFDEADVGASRATDRMELRIRTLTVRELEEGARVDVEGGASGDGEPSLLGFRSLSGQTYEAGGAQLRGERVPLFYWPRAEFGYPGGEAFPVRFKGVIYGNRSTLGRYLLLGFGGPAGPAKDPWFEWKALVGGYTEKGPSAGAEIDWNRPRSFGKLRTWGVWDFDGKDFNDYIPRDEFRWLVNFQTRNQLAKGLTLDAEFNDFSDSNVNLEYWENEELTHKEYESYGRLKYERGNFVSTLTGKWHQRYWASETAELPELNLWFTSVPLLVPKRRGGPGIDLTSTNRLGYLTRYNPILAPTQDYSAFRAQTDTRLNLVFNLSDVRVSSYGGVFATGYEGRTDDGDDTLRAAFIGGAKANLQLHRDYGGRGGIFQLDRVRHVIDLDAGFRGWWFNDVGLGEVPVFDQSDLLEERSSTVLRVRNRVQTRDPDGSTRDVLDLELSWLNYVDDVGPYGFEAPGEINYVIRGRPRQKGVIVGEGRWDIQNNEFFRASIGAGAQPSDRLSVFAGFRYVRAESTAPFFDVSWRWSEKYGFRWLQQYDFRNDENRTRFVFGRYSADHAWFFGASLRGTDDYGLEFRFSPTLGAERPGALQMFNDQPPLDPWGILR